MSVKTKMASVDARLNISRIKNISTILSTIFQV